MKKNAKKKWEKPKVEEIKIKAEVQGRIIGCGKDIQCPDAGFGPADT